MTDTTKRPPTAPQSIPQLTGRRLRLVLVLADIARRHGAVWVQSPTDAKR